MFNITLSDELIPGLDPRVTAVYGKITIGDFSERISASLACWNRQEYEHHWKSAVARIAGGQDRSALITSYVKPGLSHYLSWWPLYREADKVHIQNQMLFFAELSEPFSIERPWDFVRERQTINFDGERISEWVTSVESLREFLRNTKTT